MRYTRRVQRGVFRRRSRQYYTAPRRRLSFRVTSLPAEPERQGLSAYVDWVSNGDFTGGGDDVSGDLLRREDLTIRYGRDQQRALSPIGPGEASFLLNNKAGTYSPDREDSPLYPNVIGGKDVLLRYVYGEDAFNLFRGFISDEFTVNPSSTEESVGAEVTDALSVLSGTSITTALYSGISTGEAVEIVLDAVGWPEDKRIIDGGATSIRWFWLVDADAYEALNDIINSEGPPAMCHSDGDGNFVFRDRHHRILNSRSTTSQATWTAGDTEPVFSSEGFVYEHGWRDVINHVTATVEERDPAGELEIVWESTDTHILADGEIVTVEFQADNPFLEGALDVLEWSGTDLILYSLGGEEGSPKRTFQIEADGGPAVINRVVIMGKPVTVQRTVNVSEEDSASITKYNKRKTYPIELKWASVADVEAIAQIVLLMRAERLPILTVTFKSTGALETRHLEQLTRDLSDRVTIVENKTGVNADFYIEQITHKFTRHHELLETSFGCEMVATVDDPDDVFILGSSTQGILGTNRLAH